MGAIFSTAPTTTPPRDVALPPDVLQSVASFLLGVEVLQFSHASPTIYAALNVPEVWNTRVDPRAIRLAPLETPLWCNPAKAVYFQHRSLRFRGAHGADGWFSRGPRCGDSVDLPDELVGQMGGFSIELTFSVASDPPGSTNCHSGILIGFQDSKCTASAQVRLMNGFALVAIDRRGGLHANVEQPRYWSYPVAQLSLDKWHRLLVVFNESVIHVFLDGDFRVSMHTTRSFRLTPLHGQIGTGFRQAPRAQVFSDELDGWRPFHGLIAEARVVYTTFSAPDAYRRANGEQCVGPWRVDDLISGHSANHIQRVVATLEKKIGGCDTSLTDY